MTTTRFLKLPGLVLFFTRFSPTLFPRSTRHSTTTMRPALSSRSTLFAPCPAVRAASHFPPQSSNPASHPNPSALYTPSPSASTSDTPIENPTWSDPGYRARYRNASRHDVVSASTSTSTAPRTKTRTTTTTATTATADDGGTGKAQRSRRNRIANDALWSGGDYSPAIPLESHRTQGQSTRPKHALLFPGSGSQYVGMGLFLRDKGKGKDVWSEAEDALGGFEEWRRGLRLDQLEGDVGALGRMLDESEGARRREARMQEIVFDGPQVSVATLASTRSSLPSSDSQNS